MKRRDFIAGVAAASMLPKTIRAQQTDAVRRVAILVGEAIEDDPYYEGRIAGLREGLRDLGWIEGRNLKLDIHRTPPNETDIHNMLANYWPHDRMLSLPPEVRRPDQC